MALNMGLKIAPLKGESATKGFEDQIDVLAWSWGLSNSGSAHVGGGAGSGKANFQDLSFTKYIDSSTTDLFLAAASGKHFDQAILTVRKAGGDAPVDYMVITMSEVLISSLSTGGSGGEDRLTENVTLNFAKIKIKYTKQAKTGTAATSDEKEWDIQANTKV